MRDLIDRQGAIDAVKRLSLGETDATRLAMRIGDYLERLPSVQPQLCGYSIEYLTFIAKLMAGANVTPEVMISTIKDVEKIARMVIEMARKQVEEAIIKVIINGEGVTE